MKRIFFHLLAFFFRFILWFRYKIEVKGKELLTPETLNKPGGVLFLPNHPAVFVDPLAVALSIWPRYLMRPIIVEYQYYTPGVNWIMRLLNALPVPNFDTSANSLKRKKSEQVVDEMIKGLDKGENFVIYPAGQLKDTGKEILGGASSVHTIAQKRPETNIILVRVKGLWGSSFSRAYTGQTPPLFSVMWQGMKHVFKNLLFFTPRRKITIEFHQLPSDFPFKADRLDFNHYLEDWYNQPDGLTKQQGDLPGDSFIQVSYSCWREEIPKIAEPTEVDNKEEVDIKKVPKEIQESIKKELAAISDRDPNTITPEMHLARDLGLDSLDAAEIISFLQEKYDVDNITVPDLTSVNRVMGLASKKIFCEDTADGPKVNLQKWLKKNGRPLPEMQEGDNILEVFLNSCARMGNAAACGDDRAGILTYSEVKMRVILLAEWIKTLPGEHIGILLPASVAANLLVFAVQLAGKVPVMVNWTIGPKHLDYVIEFSGIQKVLTSWAFLDRLNNVDLTPVEDMLIMLEDERPKFTLGKKLKALFTSKFGTKSVLKKFGMDNLDPKKRAVLLFTSGTESMPKGVPLTHENILCNIRGALGVWTLNPEDVFLGILPPFHAFGFSASMLLSMLTGMRVAFSPNPTDGLKLAKAFEKWKATIVCGAPTFLKGMLKSGTPEMMESMRMCVTGAEKAPPELFTLMEKIGKKGSLVEGYGITECSPVLTLNREGVEPRGVGQPIPNVDLLVVHQETHEPLPIGETGLILAKGPNIFSGYLNPGIASPFLTVQGYQWYSTGDLGFLDELNRLTISGRLKRFIKVGGEMISLGAIEDAVMQAAPQRGWKLAEEGPSVAVCAREEPGEKTKVYLFCCFKASTDEINEVLKETGFSNLVRVSGVNAMEEIPIMGSGKINYRILESDFMPNPQPIA